MSAPDYDGGSIVNLVASVAGNFKARTGYRQLRALPARKLGKKVVLLVIDGLGYNWLMERNSWLSRNCNSRITSVFPTTTAACVTTFLTGMAPGEHGITGWFAYYRELGCTALPLPGRPRLGGVPFSLLGVDPHDLYDCRPLSERLRARSAAVLGADLAGDYNDAMLGRSDLFEYTTLTGFLRQIRRALKGRSYVYAYWPVLDGLGHAFGCRGEEFAAHFRTLDRKLSRFIPTLPNDVSVVITADHGMVDAKEVIWVEDHPVMKECLSMPLAGEPRAAYCYVHPRSVKKFERYVRTELRHACTLHRSADLLDHFGGKRRHPELLHRIGDYVLVMKDGYIIKDMLANDARQHHVGNHGGLSEDELYVPLIVM